MPAKNSSKIYVEDGYYHIFNRGVNRDLIFIDSQDYAVFKGYLRDYLSDRDEKAVLKTIGDQKTTTQERARLARSLSRKNYVSQITLLAYCLMPNHFHLFVKQKSSDAIKQFMESLGTRYSMYFNQAHKRVGTLYQGVYKAALISDDAHYLHISRYIHRQAINQGREGSEYPSSYPEYLGLRQTEWVHPEEILTFFSDRLPSMSYSAFVAEYNPVINMKDDNFELSSEPIN